MTDQLFEERKQKIYRFMQDVLYVPMRQKEIAAVLQIPREEREELRKILEALTEEGKITVSKRGKYSLNKEIRLTGIFRANLKGFGFVTVEGEDEDIYIREDQTNGAMDKDTVEIILTRAGSGRHREGRVRKIVKRGHRQGGGTFSDESGEELWIRASR